MVAAVFMTMTVPATAEPVGVQEYNRSIIRNVGNGRCLDSNWNREVYTLPCSGSFNPHQTWEIWNGGWTKNVATGYCLGIYQRGALDYVVLTGSCDSLARSQMWQHWNGGWYQSAGVVDWSTFEKLCLLSSAHPLDRNPERYPLAHKCDPYDRQMFWRANLTG